MSSSFYLQYTMKTVSSSSSVFQNPDSESLNRISETLLGITSLFLVQVLIFLLNITPEDQRKNDKITAVLAKEIQLKHRAPVIDIVVFDSGGLPVAGTVANFAGFNPLSRV